jgi:hypothetical protein
MPSLRARTRQRPSGVQALRPRLRDSLHFAAVPSTCSHWELWLGVRRDRRYQVHTSRPLHAGRLSMVPQQAAEHPPEQRRHRVNDE